MAMVDDPVDGACPCVQVNLSMTSDGRLHIGDVVMLVNMGGANRECSAVSINADVGNLIKIPTPGHSEPLWSQCRKRDHALYAHCLHHHQVHTNTPTTTSTYMSMLKSQMWSCNAVCVIAVWMAALQGRLCSMSKVLPWQLQVALPEE